MGTIKTVILGFFFLFAVNNLFSQSLKGVVMDSDSGLPIESASIYFDGTTIGTSSNAQGAFEIDVVEGVTSPLIISFMGYQRQMVHSYEANKFYKVYLLEDVNTLDEVFITSDDGMSKAEKLKQFRREFLGNTDNGRACKILNESDLIFRFNAQKNQLTASARKPVVVMNDNLQYQVSFDIQDFVIDYSYVDLLNNHFRIKSVVYAGTSFYKDLDTLNNKRIIKKRNKVYKGSTLHFMRALSKKRITEEDYKIFDGSFEVQPYKFIDIETIAGSDNVRVTLEKPLTILYDKNLQSKIHVMADDFLIDQYGNYAPVDKVLFSGYMGDNRIGDLLPLDYQLVEDK